MRSSEEVGHGFPALPLNPAGKHSYLCFSKCTPGEFRRCYAVCDLRVRGAFLEISAVLAYRRISNLRQLHAGREYEALDLHQVAGLLERAVLGAVLDDPLRGLRPDALLPRERRRVRRVDVHDAG